MQTRLVAVLHEPSIEVASYAVMAAGIGTVRRNIHFDKPVALNVIVLGSRCANLSVLRKYDDAAVVCADAYLVLSTKHAETLHATKLAALDGEALVAVIKLGANNGSNHLLSGSHVWCAADNLQDPIVFE